MTPHARRRLLVLAALLLAPLATRADSGAPLPSDLLESERNTIEVFRRASPAVVNVTNNALQRDLITTNVTAVPRGTGSGFLWDDHGHVVTNFHVIQGAQSLSVTLADGSVHDARLIGSEPRRDLAVLHFEAEGVDLQPVRLGDSASLVVGQKVLAIGNPFGLDRTLTTGVISALGREIPAPGGFSIEGVIQTDASINPGNSGGPLLDSAGRLIGVNTAIYSPSGGSAGIGFAVPAETVARIVPQLIRFGRVKRAGIGIVPLNDYVARRWGIRGVVIREVLPDSPAQRAGLQPFRVDRRGRVTSADVIVAIDGKPIARFADLASALDGHEVGETVEVVVERGGRAARFELPLQELTP